MERGDIFEINVDDMSTEGQGIGRFEGMVVFVPGAFVGDRVRVELTKVKKNYAFSRLVEITELSDRRNEKFDCRYFDMGCGGCPYGKMDYETQLMVKEGQVREKIRRLARIDEPRMNPIIGMRQEDNDENGCYRYRNKAQFPVSTGGIITRKGGIVENLGEPSVGFYRAKTHEVINTDDCYLQSEAAMAAANALRVFMEEDNITAWDPKWKKGLIRHLIVKTGFTTGEVMVIIVINGKGIPNMQKLAEMLDEAIYGVGYSLESIVLNINKNDKGQVMGDEHIVVAGAPVIRDNIGELQFEISPASFYQVNPVQTVRLYDEVRRYCAWNFEKDGHEAALKRLQKPVILDLYCGVGTIGLYCADMAGQVIGIEAVKEAVVDANRNAVINGIVNARYICGQAEKILQEYVKGKEAGKDAAGKKGMHKENKNIDPQIVECIKSADIAILDPPRAGCRLELLEALAEISVEKIVYVSCDAATMARDIKLLRQLRYEFIEATPVDMFPGTSSVECVTMLMREKR